MSFIHDSLVSKYGHRLTLIECSEILKIPVGTLRNMRVKDALPFRTYRDGLRVFANTSDVAQYLDSK